MTLSLGRVQVGLAVGVPFADEIVPSVDKDISTLVLGDPAGGIERFLLRVMQGGVLAIPFASNAPFVAGAVQYMLVSHGKRKVVDKRCHGPENLLQ